MSTSTPNCAASSSSTDRYLPFDPILPSENSAADHDSPFTPILSFMSSAGSAHAGGSRNLGSGGGGTPAAPVRSSNPERRAGPLQQLLLSRSKA